MCIRLFVWKINVFYKYEKLFWVEYCLCKIFYKELVNIEWEDFDILYDLKERMLIWNIIMWISKKYNVSYIWLILIYV